MREKFSSSARILARIQTRPQLGTRAIGGVVVGADRPRPTLLAAICNQSGLNESGKVGKETKKIDKHTNLRFQRVYVFGRATLIYYITAVKERYIIDLKHIKYILWVG